MSIWQERKKIKIHCCLKGFVQEVVVEVKCRALIKERDRDLESFEAQ